MKLLKARQPYAVYAIRCADGSRERHLLARRSVRALVLAQAHRLVDKPCGPHVIDYAIVQPLEWFPADLDSPDPQTARKDAIVMGALDMVCPKCAVPPGSDCENLISRRAGVTHFTAWPHPERITAATMDGPG